MPPKNLTWYVYIVCCSDHTLYTGITTNPVKRIAEHNQSSKGARYTRARRPVFLVYLEEQPDRSRASLREYAIKHLRRKEKEELIETFRVDII